MNDAVLARWAATQRLIGQRPRSIDCSGRILRHVSAQLDGRPLLEVTRADLEWYLGRPSLSARTRRAYRAHMRSFYGWALEEGLVSMDPTVGIRPVKIPPAVPRPILREDLELALGQADGRMLAWLLLMSLAGLRACEVGVLRPEDLQRTGDGWQLFPA